MTSFDRFERSLPALLDELAAPRTPDYFDDLLARTAATRQRPRWTFPERWFPMSAITRRFAVTPPLPWRVLGAVALLLLALIVGLLVAGRQKAHLPPPFGPAANGQIAYIDSGGAVAVGDVGSGATHIVIPGRGHDRPVFSADGAQLAFTTQRTGGGFDLQVALANGTGIRTLNATSVPQPAYLQWSPNGGSVAITYAGAVQLFDTSKTGAPTVLSAIATAEIGYGGFNDHVASFFRPPRGEELLYVRSGVAPTLVVSRPDGSGLRTLIDERSSGLGYAGLKGAQWSPDGAQAVIMISFPVNPERWHIYVVNAHGAGLRPLNASSQDPALDEGSPAWSPDGRHIALMRWSTHPDGSQDYHPIGIVDVATGAMADVGPVSNNGFFSWAWSPDGRAILEAPQDNSGQLFIVDIATGNWKLANWPVGSGVTWQRLAP